MQHLQRGLILLSLFIAAAAVADAHIERSAPDAQRDLTSKPFAVLDFMGVQAGWTVVDMFAGNGYYSEVLSHEVGTDGKVYLHNNKAYMAFADKLSDRVKDGRLPNVEVYVREVLPNLGIPVTWIMR